MMKRLRVCFILIVLNGFGFIHINAQGFQYFERNIAENKSVFGFNLNQRFETNSLTSGFVLDFVNGKFISNEQKDKCIANFKDNEIIAGEQFNLSLSYQRRFGNSTNYLYLETGETFFYETKLHQDIFILLFKGNKSFENKIASLNPLKIRSLQYFYLKAGLLRMTEKYSLKFNVGFIGGQRFLDLKTQRGELFTATDGRSIDLNLELTSNDAVGINNSFLNFLGTGILTDLAFSYNLSTNTQIGAGLEGYGFINWNKEVTERVVDTMYHFDGAEISNVLDSFSIAIKNVEELKSSFIRERENVSYKTNLPFIAYLKLSQFVIPEILQVQLKYGIIKSEFAKPFFNSSVNLYFSSTKLIGLNIDGGGYGSWNVGAQFAVCFSNKSSIHLYFNSISNLIKPSREFNLTGGMIYRKTF